VPVRGVVQPLAAVLLAVLFVTAPAAVRSDEPAPTLAADLPTGAHNVSPASGVLLTFDHMMDRASVEQGLQIQPAAGFTAQWLGNYLKLSWSLDPGEYYVLRVVGARSQTHKTLPAWELGFTTAPAPTIVGLQLGDALVVNDQRRLPLRPQLRAQFVQPMDQNLPALNLDGQLVSDLQWDATGLAATFVPTLGAGARHEITWNPAARSAAGVAPNAPFSLGFWTLAALPSNGHALDGPPMLVQVEDSGPARPQYGLQQADIVYESISEYEVNRFTVIYYSQPPAVVGPVRSTRRVAIHLREMYRGVLFSSGASDFVLGLLYQSGATYYGNATFMYREGTRFAPHNLFVSGDALQAHRHDFADRFGELRPAYAVDVPHPDVEWAGASPATELGVPLQHDFWRYSPEAGAYLRWDHDTPFNDAATGQQLRAKNLIVQHVESFLGPEIEDHNGGAHGREHVMTGEGVAEYYSNGKVVGGRWRHPDDASSMEYLDAAGNPMTFNTGLTWVHVVWP
jgi:hypothetical protein